MDLKILLMGTLAYSLVTFPLAIFWHMVLLKKQYTDFGYFKGEPNIPQGLLTIIIQGITLSLLYNYVSFSRNGVLGGLIYSLLVGIFFWTSHVLAFVAKQNVKNALNFIIMESAYLLIQFGVFGLLIGLIAQSR